MLTYNRIKTLSTRYQTTELNVWREYVQHLFLSYFYLQPQAKQIFFKGGTALRIVYHSPRFSEDLDFDTLLRDVGEIETAVLHTLLAMEREGIPSQVVSSSKTSGGYLAAIDLTVGSTTLRLRLEASFRQKRVRGEVEQIVSDFVPAYMVYILAQEELVAGKIAALLDRKKPRDFYDMYYLLQRGLISAQQKTLLAGVLPLVEQTTINFTQELKTFLPASLWPIIKDFKKVLVRAIERSI
jgi:predicted nucleotidyltransferase component of viral defense system